MNSFPFYNQQPLEQMAIKKLPNPQNYKIVKCKNFETTGINQTKKGNCKYREYCTFAHGESELRSKNENTFLVGNNSNPSTMNNNINQFNYNNPLMQMFMPQQFIGNFRDNFMGNPVESLGDYNQLNNMQGGYPFQMQMQGNENMMINPNNINLNINPLIGGGNFNGNMMGNMNSNMSGIMGNEKYMQKQ